MAEWETAPAAPAAGGWETAPAASPGGWETAPVAPVRAQPGSLSYIMQGAPAGWEAVARMLSGMAGTAAGALVGGAEALIAPQGREAGDVVRERMAAGAEQMTPKKTLFAPTASFDEYLSHLFEAMREGFGAAGAAPVGVPKDQPLRGTATAVTRALSPQEEAERTRREAVGRTLGEYAFDAPAAVAPLSIAKGAARRAPVTIEGEARREPAQAPESAPFEADAPPPVTGTSSGVPIRLDKLIAEAEYLGGGEIPTAPKPKQLIRQAAQEGLESRMPGLNEASESPTARPGGEVGLPEPPRATPEAPRAAGEAAAPRDFFLEESAHKIDVPRSEVRGGDAYSGGEGRRVFETVHFREPFEVLLADAGRDWAKPENQAAANRALKNAVDQLPPDSPFASLKAMPLDQLEIAAKQYWGDVRTELLNERRRTPEASRVQIQAPPAERVTIYRDEPKPPEGPEGMGEPPPPDAGLLGGERPGEVPRPPAAAPEKIAAQAPKRDPRLDEADYQKELRELGREAGQQEVGGKLIVDETTRGRRPGASPDVLGRTVWIAEPWYREMQRMPEVRSSPQQVRAIIDKAIAGHKLGPKQERILQYLLDEVQARFEGFVDKPRSGGGTTLSANPMFDPKQIAESVKFFADVGGKVTQQGRKWVNAVQAVSESAKPALATVWKYANEVAYARERAQQDRIVKEVTPAYLDAVKKEFADAVADARKENPKYQVGETKTVLQAIAETERARREGAKWRMQRELYKDGYAVKSTEGGQWKEFRQPSLNIADLRGPDGRLLKIRNDALPLVEQMTGAHDIARGRRYQQTLLGAAEGVSHGVVSWLMWNPFFHGMTTAGKGLIYSFPGRERASIFDHTKKAVETLSNRAELQDMMLHGARFFPKRGNMQPTGAEMGRVEKALKDIGLEQPYQWYQWVHGNLLANIVNTVQAAFYHMRLEQQVKQAKNRGETVDQKKMDVFKSAAAEESNLIGGNLPREQLAEGVYRGLGATLFSRGLTVSTVRMLTRAFENNRIIEAYARSKGFSPKESREIMTRNRNFMAASLLMDYMALQLTANVANWVATEMNDEPGGKKGGHFVWENQGSTGSQMWLPTNVFLYPETGQDGNATGRGVYASSPMRVARDIVEWVEGVYQVATGQPPRILKNKMGPMAETLLETIQGEDWAGRPLSGPADVATNIAGKVAPQPFGDIPAAVGESARTGNFGFTVEAIKKSFDPDIGIPILLGAQPRIAANDPTTIKFAVEQSKEERRLWGRVARVKQMMRGMEGETREQAIQAVLEDARKIGMTPDKIGQIARVMRAELPSRAQARASQTYQRLHNEGEIPEPPQ